MSVRDQIVELGASLFALQYMNMRAAPQDNPQQKMLLWFLPIVVLFLIIMIAVPEMTEWLPDLLEKTASVAGSGITR